MKNRKDLKIQVENEQIKMKKKLSIILNYADVAKTSFKVKPNPWKSCGKLTRSSEKFRT